MERICFQTFVNPALNDDKHWSLRIEELGLAIVVGWLVSPGKYRFIRAVEFYDERDPTFFLSYFKGQELHVFELDRQFHAFQRHLLNTDIYIPS